MCLLWEVPISENLIYTYNEDVDFGLDVAVCALLRFVPSFLKEHFYISAYLPPLSF